MSLTIRSFCPACKETKKKEIFSLPYDSRVMIDFFSSYYKGTIDIKQLSGHHYKLVECENCNLIFQEQIPNKQFSQKLYEKYINKNESFKKKTIMKKNFIKNFFMKWG